MPRKDLPTAVARLVIVATNASEKEAATRPAVNDVLRAFEGSDAKAIRSAISSIGKGLEAAHPKGRQVLYLTLGALVESGAGAELAWPVVEGGLRDRLVRSAAFARALLRRSTDELDEAGLARLASSVAKTRPRDAAAWNDLPAHALAAVACLSRSPKLRAKVRKDEALVETASALSDAIDEAGLLAQVLQLLDGERIVVLHAASGRAFHAVLRDVATNAELSVLLGAAFARDAKAGVPVPVRLDARALETLGGQRPAGAKPKELPIPFDLAPWTALDAHGALPPHEHHGHHSHDHLAPLEGSPADFPALDGVRIVVIDDAAHDASIAAEPSLPPLRPAVELRGALSAAAVARLLASMKKARAGARRRRG